MNDIAKESIAHKLTNALQNENLRTSEAAKILKVSAIYISMICNPKLWKKCPAHAWETVLTWINTGDKLMDYAKKTGVEVKPAQKVIMDNIVKVKNLNNIPETELVKLIPESENLSEMKIKQVPSIKKIIQSHELQVSEISVGTAIDTLLKAGFKLELTLRNL